MRSKTMIVIVAKTNATIEPDNEVPSICSSKLAFSVCTIELKKIKV